ncbi:hypothetical protein [Mycoplasmopsis cricetuli]|uniref:hypothetical protein n=1 Tax=Mycoplasmopsis cricetuli TaxID=171283 RepID=UPI00046E6A0C|nr:hypothetical protein [Mycoplasmopsis cricetuli]
MKKKKRYKIFLISLGLTTLITSIVVVSILLTNNKKKFPIQKPKKEINKTKKTKIEEKTPDLQNTKKESLNFKNESKNSSAANNKLNSNSIKNNVESSKINTTKKETEKINNTTTTTNNNNIKSISKQAYEKILYFLNTSKNKIKNVEFNNFDYIFTVSKIVNFYLLITSETEKDFYLYLGRTLKTNNFVKDKIIINSVNTLLKKFVKTDADVKKINRFFIQYFDLNFKKVKKVDTNLNNYQKEILDKDFPEMSKKLKKFQDEKNAKDYIKTLSNILEILQKIEKHKNLFNKLSDNYLAISFDKKI